eukprot:SAG22_NODE_5993_length_919_cov_1.197561_1_plen_188_part_10
MPGQQTALLKQLVRAATLNPIQSCGVLPFFPRPSRILLSFPGFPCGPGVLTEGLLLHAFACLPCPACLLTCPLACPQHAANPQTVLAVLTGGPISMVWEAGAAGNTLPSRLPSHCLASSSSCFSAFLAVPPQRRPQCLTQHLSFAPCLPAENLPAIFVIWYGGQMMGPAFTDVLTGVVSPAGRSPFTW